jgi:predicted nucleotidyltransferase
MIKIKINNNQHEINQYSNKIEAICLFGSSARGDNDLHSDIDVFILVYDCNEDAFVKIKKSLAYQLNIPAHWISIYRMSTIYEMHAKGSYFLWHLKKEGQILYSRKNTLNELLITLPEYKSANEDLQDYLIICNDIRKSIAKDFSTAHFELSVLASLVRNTCIAISYKHGTLVFGRIEPIIIAKKIIGQDFPFNIDEYKELYNFRISYTRGYKDLHLHNITEDYIQKWIENVEFIIKFGIMYNKEGDKNEF